MSIEIIVPFLRANTAYLHDTDAIEIDCTDGAVSSERRGRVNPKEGVRVGERDLPVAVRETSQLVWNAVPAEHPIVGGGRWTSCLLEAGVDVPCAVPHYQIREAMQVLAHPARRGGYRRAEESHPVSRFIAGENRYDVGRDGGHDGRSRGRQ